MEEVIFYLIIFIVFIAWIIREKKPETGRNLNTNKNSGASNSKEHIQYITAMEKYKIKTNKYPNMNNEDEVIAFIKCYNEAGRETEPRAGGGYYNQPYPPQNYYMPPGQWR